MLCERFSESWFNGTHKVVRRTLRPFCLWHLVYLDLIDSPLVPGARKPSNIGWDELEVASRICCLEYDQQLPVHQTMLERVRVKASLFIAMAQSTKEQQINAFIDYIEDYFAPPEFNAWKEDGMGKASKPRGGPPDPLSVASAVIMLFGGGPTIEKFVWEMPIGKAYWYSSTLHYNRGASLDYVTARERAIRNFLRAQREKGLI